MKKIITLGNGFVAAHLPYEVAKYRLTPNEEDMGSFLDQYKPDCIINATGFCGSPNVDECETKKTQTYMSNVVIPLMLAGECERRGVHLINLGSGCIFYGESPHASGEYYDSGWRETDIGNPVSHYSKTKYACDLAIGAMNNVTTLRLRMPISSMNHPRNLLNKLINYKKVLVTENSVTCLPDLVNAIDFVVKNNKSGIYHVTSLKPLTHEMILDEYKKYIPTHEYEKISEGQLRDLVKAPRSNCIIDSTKIVEEGFEFIDTLTCMRECVKDFVINKKGK